MIITVKLEMCPGDNDAPAVAIKIISDQELIKLIIFLPMCSEMG